LLSPLLGKSKTKANVFTAGPSLHEKVSCAEFLNSTIITDNMIRKAFVMSVNPGAEEEYEKRHTPIWRELEAVLKDHGVHNYSIFLHEETRQLFAFAEVEDEERWNSIAQTEVCQKWWKHMGDVMPSNPDNSPVASNLKEVFHLD